MPMPIRMPFPNHELARDRRRGPVRTVRNDETGAESVEFAFVAPVALFLIAGIIYFLLAVSAQISLHHAVSQTTRYATIPTDPVTTTYPTAAEVDAHLEQATPFFAAGSCTTSVTGEEKQNAPVTVEASCDFPNPLGAAMNGLKQAFTDDTAEFADTFTMSARGTGRRE